MWFEKLRPLHRAQALGSGARALTHLIGNGVATVVVGKWCGELDDGRMQRVLDNESVEDAEEPEKILDVVEGHTAGRNI